MSVTGGNDIHFYQAWNSLANLIVPALILPDSQPKPRIFP